eukprot:PhM_4_TR15512/c0_g1_i1/m.9023/K08857/NEK1_4_5; NIMA (never in mitosis gene a)-related kinase 1/4/5
MSSTLTSHGFVVKKSLGKGSFGEAMLAKDTRNGDRLVVVKVVRMGNMNPQERAESLQEAKTMAAVPRHPNIVQFYDSFETENTLYIVMEYAESGDLERMLKLRKKEPLTEAEVLHIFTQLCAALNHLHCLKILHRDLKLQNVFLSGTKEKPVVKLGDFGISTVLRNTHAMARTVCGTPYYFSPEICENKPYNNKSDVWSLGCILYELCTLKHAFEGANMVALMRRIIRGNPNPIPQSYSKDLASLIDAMLHRNPKARPSIRRILEEAPIVRRFLSGDVGAVPSKPSPVQPAAKQPEVAPLSKEKKMDSNDLMESIKKFQALSGKVEESGGSRGGKPASRGNTPSRGRPAPQAPPMPGRAIIDKQRRDAEKETNLRVLDLEEKRKLYEYRNDKQRMIRKEEDLQRRMEAVRQSEERRKQLEQEGWDEVGRVKANQELRAVKQMALDEHLNHLRNEMMRRQNPIPAPSDDTEFVPMTEADEYRENRRRAQEYKTRTSVDALLGNPKPHHETPTPQRVSSTPRSHVHVAQHPQPQQYVPPRQEVPVCPDNVYSGKRTLDKFSLQSLLKGAVSGLTDSNQPVDPTLDKLWREHQEKIEAQRRIDEAPAGSPEALWREQRAKIAAASSGSVDDDDDYFEEAPLPANEVSRLADMHFKFRLDGATLQVGQLNAAATPLESRCAALREFLSDKLGEAKFRDAYDILNDVRSMDEFVSDDVYAELAEQLGGTSGLMDLIVQLIVCEEMVQAKK